MSIARIIKNRGGLKAAFIHLLCSCLVASLAAGVVFFVWYPYPYSEISGGKHLFMMIVAIDVLLGPFLTLIVFNKNKKILEKSTDLFVIALIQMSALIYGMWSVAEARPVHMVFEYDRFRVVHAVEIPEELLDKTPAGIQALPWFGPSYVSLRSLRGNEKIDATLAEMNGVYAAARPDLWRPYNEAKNTIIREARPVNDLMKKNKEIGVQIDQLLKKEKIAEEELVYLPLVARKNLFWTVLVNKKTAAVIDFLPIDPYE